MKVLMTDDKKLCELYKILDQAKLDECFYMFCKTYADKYNIGYGSLVHNYSLFRLYCICNADCIDLAYDQLETTMEKLLVVYENHPEWYKNMMIEAIHQHNSALDFFWEYRNTVFQYQALKADQYNMRGQSMQLLNALAQLIENVLKKECYIISETNVKEGLCQPPQNLYQIIESLFLIIDDNYLETITSNLRNVSINQFRNIVAHASFQVKNNKICAYYGNNHYIELTIDETEKILYQVYRLRTFVKLITNLSIDIMLAKFPSLQTEIKVPAETLVKNVNFYLSPLKTEITSFEIADNYIIEKETLSIPDFTYFILEIESRNSNDLDAVKCILLSLIEFKNALGSENNLPDVENIIWGLHFKFLHKNETHFFMGYDEYSLLLKNPEAYVDNIMKKIEAENSKISDAEFTNAMDEQQ